MAREHGQHITLRKFGQRLLSMLGKRSALGSDLHQRVMHRDQRLFALRQGVDLRKCLLQGSVRHPALGPVEARLRANRRFQRDNRNAGQIESTFNHGFHSLEPLVGIEEALDHIEIGHVVITHLDGDRHIQRRDPFARGGKFAVARPHGQIAGYQHCSGPVFGDFIPHPVKSDVAFQTEMNVAQVKQQGRFSHCAVQADRP